jgi:ParB family chromosome partitioning protein
VARLKTAPAHPVPSGPTRDTLRLEEVLSDTLGMTAQLHSGKKGSGKLTLHFGSAEELQGLLQRLGIQM